LQDFFWDAPRLIVGIDWQPAGQGSHSRLSIMLADDAPEAGAAGAVAGLGLCRQPGRVGRPR
jgi:hypothetical protein